MHLRDHFELGHAANLPSSAHLTVWHTPRLPHRCSFSVVVNPDETVLGSMQKELKDEGVDLKDVDKTAEATAKADLKELSLKELKELEKQPQDPNRHEFVVPRMPKESVPMKQEEPRMPSPKGPAPGPPAEGYAGYEEPYYEDQENYEDYEDLASAGEEPEMPLLDQDLERADIRYDSKVDPQLNRIADQVNAKIDMVEERLLGDRLQNLVVPFPASDASRDASTVHVFLGNPSTTTPDVGTPLDDVNKLLQRADGIEKGLVATSNLQVQQCAPLHAIYAGLLTSGCGSRIARFQTRRAGFL